MTSASRTRQYQAWVNMRRRCQEPGYTNFKYWGGRGVTVCAKWQTFAGFWEDMAEGYGETLSLDRIDGSKGYCKENCRWATRLQQNRNKSDVRRVTAFGETKTIPEWAQDPRCTCSRKTLWARLRYGIAPERAITSGSYARRIVTC